MLMLLSVFRKGVKREPGENPGLPRSGKAGTNAIIEAPVSPGSDGY
jgi:hypothetical protein